MKLRNIATGLLLASVIATPGFANWFDNYMVGENHKKLVGSTTNPTPDDLRAIGDSDAGAGKDYHFDPKDGHWHEVRPSDSDKEATRGASGSGSAAPGVGAGVAPAPPARP